MFKKVISLILSIIIIFVSIPLQSFAHDIDGVYYVPSVVQFGENDYKGLQLYYKQSGVEASSGFKITKPTSTMQVSANGQVKGDSGIPELPNVINSYVGQPISIDFSQSSPGTASSIAEIGLQITNGTGLVTDWSSLPNGGSSTAYASQYPFSRGTVSFTPTQPGTYTICGEVLANIDKSTVFEHWDVWSENGSHASPDSVTAHNSDPSGYNDGIATYNGYGWVRSYPVTWHFEQVIVNVAPLGTDTVRYKDKATGLEIAQPKITGNIPTVPSTPLTEDPPVIAGYQSTGITYIQFYSNTPGDESLANSQTQQPYSSPVNVTITEANQNGYIYFFYDAVPPTAGRVNIYQIDSATDKLLGSKVVDNITLPSNYTVKSTDMTTPTNSTFDGSNMSYAATVPAAAARDTSATSQTANLSDTQKEAWIYLYYKVTSPVPTPTPTPTPSPAYKPPVAIINAPDTVPAGEFIGVTSGSYDQNPGGTITKYVWIYPDAYGAIQNSGGAVSYDTLGVKTISLIVWNEHDLAASVDKKITVTPPYPTAVIGVTGNLKENRKFNITSASSRSPIRFPIDTTKTTWTITPITGGSASVIKYSGSLTGSITKDMLIKVAGTYKITLTVTNTAGYTNTAEKTITINPDVAPICSFTIDPTAYRSASDSNNATFNITDMSYSSDGDYISSRLYEYCYDSNNDGIFNEAWTAFNSGNNTTAVLKINQVGRYKVRETITEGFGQETISEFIVPSDHRTASLVKDIEVKNTAPVTSLKAYKRKNVDVEILTDYTGQKLSDLQSTLNTFKSNLYSKGADVNFNIVDGSQTKQIATATRRRLIMNNTIDVTNFLLQFLTKINTYDDNGDPYSIRRMRTFDTPTTYLGLPNVVQVTGPGVNYREGDTYFPTVKTDDPVVYTMQDFWDGYYVPTGYYDYNDNEIYNFVKVTYLGNYPVFSGGLTGAYSCVTKDNQPGNKYGKYALDKFGNVWYGAYTPAGYKTLGTLNPVTVAYGVEYKWTRVEGLSGIVQINSYSSDWLIALKYDNTAYFLGKDYSNATNTSKALYNPVPSPYAVYDTPTPFNYSWWMGADIMAMGYSQMGGSSPAGLTVFQNQSNGYSTHFIQYYNGTPSWNTFGWLISAGDNYFYKDTVTPINTVDSDKIKNLSLTNNSDRYFLYISDGQGEDYTSGAGNYFGFSGLNKSFLDYLNNNGFTNYAVSSSADYDFNSTLPEQEITLRNFINNSVNGGYLNDRGQLQTALNSIMSKYGTRQEVTQYALVNEKIDYTTQYSDSENDSKYAERFKFTHTDPYYFNNSYGLFGSSGVYVASPFSSIDKVGKFDVVYSARDNPKNDSNFDNYRLWSNENLSKLTLLVHRRPIAQFNFSFTSKDGSGNYIPTIIDTSLDWDHTSRADRGIQAWEWKYKEINASSWTLGQPSVIPAGQTYMISLRVQDIEGEWSYPFIKTVTARGIDLTPTVDANPVSYGWVNSDIPVTITANDNGENDFNRTTYKKSTSAVDPGTIDGTMYQKVFPITYTTEGIWYLHLHVFDNAGNTFYRFRGPYKIDKTLPGISAVPFGQNWTNQNVTVSLNPWDALSGVQKWRYAASDNDGASWGAWTGYAWGPAYTSAAISYEGVHRLMAEVTDNAGNVAYIMTDRYCIDKTAPVIHSDLDGPVEVSESLRVNLSLYDSLSGVKQTRYVFSNTAQKPDGGWITTAEVNFSAKTSQEGIWYLHVECEDNAGNISYRVFGSFEIVSLSIYDLTVTMINDIIWRDYYYEGTVFNTAGKPIQFRRKAGTDIKASQMPINNYNGMGIVNYGQIGIDSGCEVNFYLRTYGNPSEVIVYAYYITTEGYKTMTIEPVSTEDQLWQYTFTVPLECISGTYISFDAEALKDGTWYGAEYWTEPWLPLNTDRKIFYISGNAVDRLKFNQSH